MKTLKVKHEEDLRMRDLFLQRLVTKSIEIKNKILTIDEKKNP